METDQNLEDQRETNHHGHVHEHLQGNSSSRWNPTKEQISMLQHIYMQGIRTPTADQIQQITARLKDHGDIQGKNVFYWFQNHKARQRQKLKQENNICCLHNAQPAVVPCPPPSNAVFGSFYIPPRDLGFYPQYSKVLLPTTTSSFKRRPRNGKINQERAINHIMNQENGVHREKYYKKHQETLPLFPLSPTGVNFHANNNASTTSSTTATPSSCSSDHETSSVGVEEYYCKDKPFFDFFPRRQ